MSYTVERVDVDEALRKISEYQYALVYQMSELLFCSTEKLSRINLDECLEARFFDADKELHMYEEDGSWCAVKAYGTEDDDCLTKRYKLQDEYFGKGRYLCVCEHLTYDEDGQAAVARTRLTGIAKEVNV